MVALALLVSLLVLPGLLLVVAPSRQGEEYDPHSRVTAAMRTPGSE